MRCVIVRAALIVVAVGGACGQGKPSGGAIASSGDDAGAIDAAIDPQLRGDLEALARARLAALVAEAPPLEDDGVAIPAIGPCARLDPAAGAKVAAEVARWIARTHPGHRIVMDTPDVVLGCADPAGVIVDAHADLAGRGRRTGWWWTLRVRGAAIEVLAAASGLAVEDYTDEWDLHTTQRTLVIADLDGDGTREPLIGKNVHEGNAPASYTLFASSMAGAIPIGSHDGDVGIATLPSTEPGVVVALAGNDDRELYRCVTGPVPWSICPAAERARRHADARAAAQALVAAATPPDRDELDRMLALLDVPDAARAALVARTRPTTAREAIEDFVAARQDARRARTAVEQQAAADAVADRLARALRGALGEAYCPAATAGERKILVANLVR